MKLERYATRRRDALARVIVGRGADAAEAEHDVARRKAAAKRLGQALRIVAEILSPGKPQAAARERADQKAEVFVLALSDQQLVADDVGPEHGADSRRLSLPTVRALPARRCACR